MAAFKGHLPCVTCLMKYNASLTKKCAKGLTAVQYAEKGGKQVIVACGHTIDLPPDRL